MIGIYSSNKHSCYRVNGAARLWTKNPLLVFFRRLLPDFHRTLPLANCPLPSERTFALLNDAKYKCYNH